MSHITLVKDCHLPASAATTYVWLQVARTQELEDEVSELQASVSQLSSQLSTVKVSFIIMTLRIIVSTTNTILRQRSRRRWLLPQLASKRSRG